MQLGLRIYKQYTIDNNSSNKIYLLPQPGECNNKQRATLDKPKCTKKCHTVDIEEHESIIIASYSFGTINNNAMVYQVISILDMPHTLTIDTPMADFRSWFTN